MTRKASDSGIIEITNAVERIGVERDWARQSSHWIEETSRIYKERYPQSGGSTGISLQTWNRFRSGKAVNNIAFEIFCQVLDLDWEEVVQLESNSPTLNSFSYIPACGMNKPPEKRKVFNDYSGERAIHELWADPLAYIKAKIAAYIKAKIESTEEGERFLRINFVRQGWGVNVTISPSNGTPVNASGYKYIKFKIKSPQGQKVGVRVRIVDADYVFWGYGEHKIYEYKGLSTSLDKWHDITIDLKTKKWFHFDYDGLPLKRHKSKPNFKAIQLITLEVGTDENPLNEEHITRLGKNEKEALIDVSSILFE